MTDSILFAPSTDWAFFLITLYCTGLALFTMGLIAWHDYRTFEINYPLLALAASATLTVIIATGGASAVPAAIGAAGFCGSMTWIAYRLKPGRIGMGDIPLMAFAGLVAGPEGMIPMLAAIALCCVFTAAIYSIQRRKRLFRSMFPMALPVMPAAALALGLRFVQPGDGRAEMIETWVMNVLILGTCVAAAFVVGIAIGTRRHSSRERT